MYLTSPRRRRVFPHVVRAHARTSALRVRTILGATAISLALLYTFTFAPNASAAGTFIVDPSHPASSDFGPGDAAAPFRTLSAAVAAKSGPDVTILVRPAVYRERVIIGASGRPGHPYVLRADGPGVRIEGTEDFAFALLWAPFIGDVWLTTAATWRPVNVFADNLRLTPSTSAPSALAPGEFRWVSGVGLYMNAGGGNPAEHAVAVGARTHGFLIAGRSDVRIEGFEITRCESNGIEVLAGAHDVALENNTITLSGAGGISLESCYGIVVRGNKVSRSNHHGILLRLGVSGAVLTDNESFANAHQGEAWANGIYLSGSSGNVLLRNNVHHNQDTGIEIQSGSNDNRLRQNRSWSNGDHGFEHLFASGTLGINNVAWGNAHDGFSVEGSSTGTRLYNCIAAENGLGAQGYNLFVDSSSVAGFDADFHVSWKSDGTPPVKYNRVTYPTLAAFIASTGVGGHTSYGDPRFVDPASGDFHLLAGSPAIDAANSEVPYFNEFDAEGHGAADDPATANTGFGFTQFADRGAYEFAGVTLSVGGSPAVNAFNAFRVAPNPVRGSAMFSLDLAAAAEVEYSVFDVSGREVWGETRALTAGRSELRWALRNRSGASVPMGVYLARFSTSGRSETVRFVVMR